VDALPLFTLHNLALLSDWLSQTEALLLYIYWPHSAGSNAYYFFHTLPELRSIITDQHASEIDIMIFRDSNYLLRGMVTDAFIKDAFTQFQADELYTLIGPAPDTSNKWLYLSDGQIGNQLQQDLEEWKETEVAIVVDPTQQQDRRSHLEPRYALRIVVTRNQSYYQPYADNPEKYAWLQDVWNQSGGG
jgi:hypothetical protein